VRDESSETTSDCHARGYYFLLRSRPSSCFASAAAQDRYPQARIITVATVAPLKQDLDIRLTYTADISPNQSVNLFSRVDGYIAKIYVDKGDWSKPTSF